MGKIEEFVIMECPVCGSFFEVPRSLQQKVRCGRCDGNIEDEQEWKGVTTDNGRGGRVPDKQDLGGELNEPEEALEEKAVPSADSDAGKGRYKSVPKKSSVQSRNGSKGKSGRSKGK